jgi:hypothetical protein
VDVDLGGAGLRGAYLEGADLSRSDLTEADMSWTNLNSANLEGATLDGANLASAQCDEATTWPEGFDVPDEMRFVSQRSAVPRASTASPPASRPED